MSTTPAVSVETSLQRAVGQVAAPDQAFTADVNHLAERAAELAATFVAHGDAFPSGEEEDPTDAEARLTHFVWADQAKHFMVLYRNVQLQLQTAALLETDGEAAAGLVDQLHRRSHQTLQRALAEWEQNLQQTRQQLGNPPAAGRMLRAWKLQRNPWPVYRAQIAEAGAQSQALAREFGVLNELTEVFARLREVIHRSVQAAADLIGQAVSGADETVAFVLEKDGPHATARPGRIVSRLEGQIAEAAPPPQIHDFTNEINALTAQLPEATQVTVGADHGVLSYKDVNFRRATDQWISAEVLPQLYELWELAEQLHGGYGVAVSNVYNRALVIVNAERDADAEPAAYEAEEFSQPFYNFLARGRTTQQNFDPIAENLKGLVDADLKLTSVYRDDAGFLPLPLQTGINEFTRRQGQWLIPLRGWADRVVAGVRGWLGNAEREDRMSVSEKVARVIEQRKPIPGNEAYTNILLTKGYIGESFLVGRAQETAHLSQLIGQWRAGYRGAVVLTGRRLSGKSLFGEMISNRLFPNNVIRLVPNGVISVQGRRMTTRGKLAPALAFVQKHTLQTRPMVWIDDLELWWDNDTTLAENVRALAAHIDSYSTRIFYLVSTTNAVYAHLNRYQELDRIFQAEVNLDTFSVSDMQTAIRIRHGATHKLLVDNDGEPLSDLRFNRMVRKLHRASYGNVGDTLNRWAYLMEYCDEDSVTPNPTRRYRLPAFLGADTGILLATVYFERRTNEYHLRRLFGPAFDQRYRSVLQRLLRVGLLERAGDGSLTIRESVVTDVARALVNNDYLKTDA